MSLTYIPQIRFPHPWARALRPKALAYFACAQQHPDQITPGAFIRGPSHPVIGFQLHNDISAYLHQLVNVFIHNSESHCFLVRFLLSVHIYTMFTRSEIFEIIEARRKELNLSQAELSARAFGRNDSSAVQNIRRGSAPSIEKVSALLDALNLELTITHPGQSGSGTRQTGFAEAAQEFIEMSIDGDPEALRMGYLPIPFNLDDASHRGAAPVAISRAWLDDQGLVPDHLSFAQVANPKMSSIPGNALVLINSADRTRLDGRLFAFSLNLKISIANLSRLRTGTILATYDIGENPPEEHDPHSIRILGALAWMGASI